MRIYRNSRIILNNVEILYLYPASAVNTSVVIDAAKTNPWPRLIPTDSLHHGQLVDQPAHETVRRNPTEEQIAKANARYDFIAPLVSDEWMAEPGTRWARISSRANEVGCAANTIIHLLRRYWLNGQVVGALIFFRSERRRSNRKPREGRGVPGRKAAHYEKFDPSDEDREIMTSFIRSHYFDQKMSMHDTWVDMLRKKYGALREHPAEWYLGNAPSERQLRSQMDRVFTRIEQKVARKGRKAYEQTDKPIKSKKQSLGAGHIYEADATVMDVFIVSSIDRDRIIGKPCLIYIIDVSTQLLVGWYLGLETPSWWTVLNAIFSIAADKRSLCERYNIPYDPNDWPAHGILPTEVHADRGPEFLNEASGKFSTELDTTWLNLPPNSPEWKPYVEARFHSGHVAISSLVPGYEPGKYFGKRKNDVPKGRACLTLDDLQRIVVLEFISRNKRPLKNRDLTNLELAHDLMPTPINLWNHSIEYVSGSLSFFTEHALRTAMLPKEEAIITSAGIKLGDLYYDPIGVNMDNLFIRDTERTRHRPLSAYAARNQVDIIYVDYCGQLVAAKLTEASREYLGLSRAEAEFRRFWLNRIHFEGGQLALTQEMNFRDAADQTVAAAKSMRNTAGKPMSVYARTQKITEYRTAEATADRVRRATHQPVSDSPASSSGPTDASVGQGKPSTSQPRLGSAMSDRIRRIRSAYEE